MQTLNAISLLSIVITYEKIPANDFISIFPQKKAIPNVTLEPV